MQFCLVLILVIYYHFNAKQQINILEIIISQNNHKLIMFKEAKIHESMHECDNCKQKENYFSVATNCTEIRIFFLTDYIIRIRAGFDGDFAEESYSLVTTAWEDRMDPFLKDYRKKSRPLTCSGRWNRSGRDPGKRTESSYRKRSFPHLCLR